MDGVKQNSLIFLRTMKSGSFMVVKPRVVIFIFQAKKIKIALNFSCIFQTLTVRHGKKKTLAYIGPGNSDIWIKAVKQNKACILKQMQCRGSPPPTILKPIMNRFQV